MCVLPNFPYSETSSDELHSVYIVFQAVDRLVTVIQLYCVTSNITDVSNYSDGVMNYFLTFNLIVHVNSLEYFLL